MCGAFTEYFDYGGHFVSRNHRMPGMEVRSISRIFAAVYVVSACAFLFDAVLIAQLPQGFRFSRTIATDLLLATILTGCAVFLEARHYRRLAIACFALANVIALKTINIIAHLAPAYIGRNFDFIDDALMMSDRFIGFDWVAYFKWHAEHPVFAEICRVSYLMWPYMALAIVVILACYGQAERLARFLIATALSLAAVYIIAIFVPSYGAYVQHAMSHDRHPGLFIQFADFKPAYDALRAGIVDVYADQIPEGAISFPSFHTTTVLLWIWAAWRTPARWFVFVQQVGCFLAIPVQGAHFVSDMIPGVVIGVAALVASGAIMRIFVQADAKAQLAPVGAGLQIGARGSPVIPPAQTK